MRMWKVNPKILCRKHLLGEHLEMHMFYGCIKKGKDINGYIKKGLVETHSIKQRHDELAKEMERRKYNHKSSLLDEINNRKGKVDENKSLMELISRCEECRKRYRNINKIMIRK